MFDPREADVDWQRNPPKSEWEVARRSVFWLMREAETKLAQLRVLMAEFPLDTKPDLQKALKMMEAGRDAARHSADIDNAFIQFLKDTNQWPKS